MQPQSSGVLSMLLGAAVAVAASLLVVHPSKGAKSSDPIADVDMPFERGMIALASADLDEAIAPDPTPEPAPGPDPSPEPPAAELSPSQQPPARYVIYGWAPWCSPCKGLPERVFPPLTASSWTVGNTETSHIRPINVDTWAGWDAVSATVPFLVLVQDGKVIEVRNQSQNLLTYWDVIEMYSRGRLKRP